MQTEQIVVDELKKQAREAGYLVLAVRESDVWLIAVCVVYFLLGWAWASG